MEDGYHILKDVAERIYLVGLSMGGMLSLLMSTRLKVNGVVAMSTPFRIPYDYPIWIIRLLSKVIPFQPKGKEEPGASWYDKGAFQEHVSYPQNPVRSGAELQQLAAQMRRALPAVEVPVLLIHSKNDDYVLPGNMESIFENLGTVDKRMTWVTEAGHVVTRDAARGDVFSAAAKFIQEIESSA